METLTLEQIKELQEHQPIKYGTLKMTAAVTVTLILLANCMWFGFSITKQLTGKVPGDLNAGIGALFMVITMLGIGIYMVTGIRRDWTRWFWNRNVRWYAARFWLADAGNLQHIILPYAEDKKDRTPRYTTTRRPCAIAVSLSLNGRIARSWLAFANKVSDSIIESRIAGWSVRLRAILDTGAVMVEIRKHNRFWDVDERIVTDIGSALRYLEEIATTVGSAASSVSDFVTWQALSLDVARREREELEHCLLPLVNPSGQVPADRQFVEYIYEQVRRLIAERDAARGEVDRHVNGFLPAAVKDRDAARQERDEAVKFVDGLAQEIEQGSRLSGTIEALRLLDRMLNWLCWAAVKDSPEHRVFQDRLALVRGKLAEKQRRDRRRHGKGVTVAT